MDEPFIRLGKHPYRALPAQHSPSFLDVLDCLGYPAVILDKGALVVGTNLRADRLLGVDLFLRAGRIVASDRASDQMLQDLVGTVISGKALDCDVLLPPVTVMRTGGRPVVIQLLPTSGSAWAVGQNAGAMLLLTCLDATNAIPESRLILLFKLTPAEARLAARLATGDALEDIADALDISIGTARNHLKAIFSKTDTNRQPELVALLGRVSALALSRSLL